MAYDKIDFRQEGLYDMEINKDRDLNAELSTYYYSGSTLMNFSFDDYTGATLQVRKKYNSPFVELEFSTDDSSISFSTGNTFTMTKTAEQLTGLRAGEYEYDMYLSSATQLKRAFLSGKFIITDRVTR